MAYIYKITNTINNKIYIGKTEYVSPEKRWRQHILESKKLKNKNRPLYKAFNKYGVQNFSFEILEETDDPESKEIYYIKKYNSFHTGYNATLGGDGRKRITDYENIINYTINNSSKSFKDIAKDLNICKDSLVKILKEHNIKFRPNRTLCKEVVQYDKQYNIINTFETAREAAKYLGDINLNAHINSCCNNKRKTCKGFIWKFKSDVEEKV